MTARRLLAAALACAALAGPGCGGDDASGARGQLTVSAAASLTEAFQTYGDRLDSLHVRFSFAGSDELAGQIRQGAPVDVYAAANTELPLMLFDEGLVERPTTFTTNRLVLAVPMGSDINAVGDLAESGIDLVIGTEDVPFGAYTRTVLDRLAPAERDAILHNVRSEESDVKAAVGKLAQGAADASFVYASDIVAAGDRVRGIELPPALDPDVSYGVAVVVGTEHEDAAREFVHGLLSGDGARALEQAGFGAPGGR